MNGSNLLSQRSLCTKHWEISQPEKANALSTDPIAQVGKLGLRETTSIACGNTEAEGRAGVLHHSMILEVISFHTRCLSSPATSLGYNAQLREGA